MNKNIIKYGAIVVLVMVTISIHFIPKRDKIDTSVVNHLNGIILSNNKLADTNEYLNVVEIEDGTIWAYKSVFQLVQTEEQQNISKPSHKIKNDNTIIIIKAL